VSVTGKVAKAAEPKTTASTASSTTETTAAAVAAAEPADGQVAAAPHAATTGEGGAESGSQDHAGAEGSALKDAAPVVAQADASTSTAPTFVAPGTTAAPTPVVAAQLPKASPETVSHLTTEIASKAVVGKTSRFDVVLQPEGLGRVDVRIEIAKDGKLTAALNFDNPAAAADMRGKSGELRQALAAAGFNVADNALSFDSSSQQGQNQNAFFNFQNQQGGDSRQAFHGRAFQSALNEDIPLAPSALLPGLRVAEASGVDVRI
jgi:flagellar hook-length control protein FliK